MRTTRTTPLILASVLPPVFGACFAVLPSRGGGQTEFTDARRVDAADVALPPGYSIEVVATGLHFPTGVAFDAEGRPHVTESGYSYGPVWLTPRLFRAEPNGALTLVVAGGDPPWNGLTYHDGAFFVAAAGHRAGGRILRVTPDGVSRTVADRLPSLGDHHTNGPVIGPDGWLYFGQGTATNSGIVGLDSYHQFGWLQRNPEVHDIPCRDVTLAGVDYTTENPFTPDDADRAGTGAFVPVADSTARGQIVRGSLPCNGAVLRVRPEGGPLELVAWGFRNPFGLAWSPDGRLFATDNGPDERGSR